MELDYDYICTNLCSMTGLQVRLYQGHEAAVIFQNANFSPDPVIQVLDEIIADENSVSYWVTKEYLYYGVIKVREDDLCIVIGPTMQIKPDKSRALSVLFSLGEPRSRLPEWMSFLETIPSYPLLNFVQILCSVNYFLNHEPFVPSDLLLKGDLEIPAMSSVETPSSTKAEFEEPIHNTYDFEQTLFSYLRNGQTGKLKSMLKSQPTGRPGKIAYDELRQQKNLFVCAVTLATRAAIEGGLEKETAFSLSDLYIQSMERLYSLNDISRLSTKMLVDFTERVAGVLQSGCTTKLSKNVHNFIITNIDCRLSTAEIAQSMQMNRTYLCEQFRQDTGKSLHVYITEQKVNEAKRLLHTTTKPIIEISDHLGFSSQSYFQNIFKKATGKTPGQFREQITPKNRS